MRKLHPARFLALIRAVLTDRTRRISLALGGVIAAAAAVLFTYSPPLLSRLELYTQDVRFRTRTPVTEHPSISHIDIDDSSIEKIGQFPWPRSKYAQLIKALDSMGARLIFLDIEFDAHQERENDEAFRKAMRESGKVLVAYHFDRSEDIPAVVMSAMPRIKSVMLRNLSARPEDIAREAGVPLSAFQEIPRTLRRSAAVSLILDFFESEKRYALDDVRAYFASHHRGPLPFPDDLLSEFYKTSRSIWTLREKTGAVASAGKPVPAFQTEIMTPPILELAEALNGAGYVNMKRDVDGVIRRSPLYLEYRGKLFPHAGLEIARRYLEYEGNRVDITVTEDDGIHILLNGPSGQRTLKVPVDSTGQTLVNWAGSSERLAFHDSRLPFATVLDYFDKYRAVYEAMSRFPTHEELLKYIRGEQRKLETVVKDLSKPEKMRENAQKQFDVFSEIIRDFDRIVQIRNKVKDRICFIGSASSASGDLLSNPLRDVSPGVDNVSSLVNMILTERYVREEPRLLRLIVIFVLCMIIAVGASLFLPAVAFLGGTALLLLFYIPSFFVFDSAGIAHGWAGPFSGGFACFAFVSSYRLGIEWRSRKRLQNQLAGRTSPALVVEIMKNPDSYHKPRKVEATMFFSDVKGFTTITEEMPPESMVKFVNEYHDRMSGIILAHGAFLDKYIGDGIMAVFGVPIYTPDHAWRACRAALENILALGDLNKKLQISGFPAIDIRIGINSGEVIAGAIGSAQRSDFTVVGDHVNLAARLEGINKEYGTKLVISETTYSLVKNDVVVREVDTVRVVGKKRSVTIYELLTLASDTQTWDPRWLDLYRSGLQAFRRRDWKQAEDYFIKTSDVNSRDRLARIYLNRTRDFIKQPPPADWDGVYDALSK